MLEKHDNQHTYKRCLTRIIIRLDRDEPTELREDVLTMAFQCIGDPAHAPEWQPWPGASESEQGDLHTARQTLNSWIAQRFITAFFDKVAMDRDRRLFWLQYAPHITRFKVFGDSETRYKLRRDERIRRYVDARFDRIKGQHECHAYADSRSRHRRIRPDGWSMLRSSKRRLPLPIL